MKNKSIIVMGRKIFAIISGLFLAGLVCAQNADTLTNNSIMKMVKAKLSDELVIEVIQSSPVRFDFAESSMTILKEQNVSQTIIEAMKKASGFTNEATPDLLAKPENKTPSVAIPAPPSQEKPVTAEPAVAPAVKSAEPAAEEVAIGYAAPLKNLITFHEAQFDELVSAIEKWDKKINALTDTKKRAWGLVTQTGDLLTEKKNADAKGFSSEIIDLKKKLNGYREDYKKTKDDMMKGGETIVKEIENFNSQKIKAAGNAYSDASQEIKSADNDPSTSPVTVSVTPKSLQMGDKTNSYLSPLQEMLVWHRNMITEIEKVIKKWNEKVKETYASDKELSLQLEPLKSKLDSYQSDTKKYKTEIAALKKQISVVEKGRKNLRGKMDDDSRELAGYIKDVKADIQKTLEQRSADIIENINYSFREN